MCLVGRNGSGKSTLLRTIAGLIEPDQGERTVMPGLRISYLPQEPEISGYETLFSYVGSGLSGAEKEESYRIEGALDEVKLDGGLRPDTLSGGELRRAAIARAFVSAPDLLLLDEPTNHLDIQAIEWLEQKLMGYRGTFVVISHDRAFLIRLTNGCLWLDQGNLRRNSEGFAKFSDWAGHVMREEENERARHKTKLRTELAWLQTGVTARRKRNQGRLKRLQELREARARTIARFDKSRIAAESGAASGKRVIEAKNITLSFGANRIVENFSTRINRGDRIGLIGPNGAGKTTLLELLMKDLPPDAGSVLHGANLTPLVIDQKRQELSAGETVREILTGGRHDHIEVRGRPRHIASYLQDFLFDPAQMDSPVQTLSGGERNRLLLAKMLAKESNLMVLDEPTNDLDLETLDLLQDVLSDYDGTVLLVSHDRDFLDRLVTSTIVLEGDGQAIEYPGGYSDYVGQRPKKNAAEKPKQARPIKTEAAKGPKPARLSYKDQRRLDSLEKEMQELAKIIETLEAELADPDLYARDKKRFDLAGARLTLSREKLEAFEEEWLMLEMQKEGLPS